jgi:hypothetical protein
MTWRGLMLWCFGVSTVLFVGATGATIYQVISPQHARTVTSIVPPSSPDATATAPVATALAEPQPVVPAATFAPPPSSRVPPLSAPLARTATTPDGAAHPGMPVIKRLTAPVVAARHPIHLPARPATATAQRLVPSYPPPPATAYGYPRYVYYAGYPPPATAYGYPRYLYYAGYPSYAYYRANAYYRVY